MVKTKTILLDLDGTLVNTMSDEYAKYRDGKADINLNNVPLFDGALDFVKRISNNGNEVFIVSDSHPRYVEPIASKIFKLKSLSLAYKPNLEKITEFIKQNSTIQLPSSRIFMVGDSPLDITTARKLKVPSVYVEHKNDFQPETWAAARKCGPTYCCDGLKEVENVINNPLENLLSIEGIPYSKNCKGSIQIGGVKYRSHGGKKLFKIALARQDVGPCDTFAKSVWYNKFSSPDRDKEFLNSLAEGVGNFIKYFEKHEGISFDVISYVSDKKTTVPRNKMREFVEMIDIGTPVQSVTSWRADIDGSIRNQPKRGKRYDFVKKYLFVDVNSRISGKNLVIIDDQLTTGATMDAVTEMLWDCNANHVLYISLFRIIDEISSGKLCPKCGKEMSIRNRKRDGQKFYSCVPTQFGGTGCGKIVNFD
jgi:phosphoglycolate phosphatase-like HAD superfamily hydrolase/predicted RNA-binding Zn-ribbon protein involved in translation (DUF1610 family)